MRSEPERNAIQNDFKSAEHGFGCKVRRFKSSPILTTVLRLTAGFRDPLIEQIGEAILVELKAETSAGRLLVESLALSLTARLIQRHMGSRTVPMNFQRGAGGLDPQRLSETLEFIEAHLEADLTIRSLAKPRASAVFLSYESLRRQSAALHLST
jgi:hypothetical protein